MKEAAARDGGRSRIRGNAMQRYAAAQLGL